MTTVRRITVRFGTDTKQYQDGLKKAVSATDQAAKRISRLLLPLASLFAGKQLFTGFLGADQVGRFAESIGASVQTIDSWGKAVQIAGGSADSFRSSLSQLNTNVQQLAATGEGRAKKTFEALGISIRNTNGQIKTGEELLLNLADRIEGLDKATSFGLLRRLGLDDSTISLLQRGRGDLERILKTTKQYAFTEEDTRKARAFNQAAVEARFSVESFAAVLLRMAVPVLTKIARGFTDVTNTLAASDQYIKILAGTVTVVALPAFAKLAALLLANPFVATAAAIGAISLAIDDLLTDIDGGDSAVDRLRAQFASLHPILQILTFPLIQIADLLKVIDEYSRGAGGIGQFWKDVGAWLNPIPRLKSQYKYLTDSDYRQEQAEHGRAVALPQSYYANQAAKAGNATQNVTVNNNFERIDVTAGTVTQGVVALEQEFKSRFTQSIDVSRMAQNG